uniref:Pro-interleukin-16 n=1 Tax=Sphenodon punctatus TaxID=8508 RepID=A0A8D0H8P7_SPHPU
MSEDNSHLDLPPNMNTNEENQNHSCSEAVLQKSEVETVNSNAHKSDESDSVKKGPPVAPKPAWFRQSLKGLRKGNSLPDQSSSDHQCFSGKELGSSITRISTRGSSIKQRISSFETFSAPQSPEKGSRKLSPKLSVQIDKSPSRREPEMAAVHLSQVSCSRVECQGFENSQPQSNQSVTSDEKSQDLSCSPKESLRSSPRRSSSTSDETSLSLTPPQVTKLHYPAAKTQRQRSRSFPLTAAQTSEMSKANDESYSKIYSISNHVSSALMKSLCLFCRGLLSQFCFLFSFSKWASLSELRDYTTNQSDNEREEIKQEPCSPQASGVSGQSVISLLTPEELEKLIEEVKSLDEATLKQLDDIHVTVLHKEEGAGLGFSLAGGSDLENKAVTVHRVFPNGLASQEGTIHKGDEVLSINGKSLKGATHNDASAIMRQARQSKQAVIVTKRVKGGERSHNVSIDSSSSIASEASTDSTTEDTVCITVTLEKTSAGLGFSLEGGKVSIHGDKPIVVNRIFKGLGSDQSSPVQPGDELLQLHTTVMQGLTRFEAWNILKALPDGPITAIIKRKKNPSITTESTDSAKEEE